MNIDPADKPSKAAALKARRELQTWTDRIRDTVACPRCEAKPGEYCVWRHGGPKKAIHPRRRKLYLLTPSELAPPDQSTDALSSKVRKG